MQAIILAGGLGSRLSEQTDRIPKPLVEVGNRPILWHIMKVYEASGITDFIICLGYKGEKIKEYFNDYYLNANDVEINLQKGSTEIFNRNAEPWTIKLIDTGLETMTGGRLTRILPWVEGEECLVTYGDGLSDINIRSVIDTHRSLGRMATVTAVRPPARFGALGIDDGCVTSFQEKPLGDNTWINGGFFVFNRKAFDYFGNDSSVLEQDPLTNLCKDGQLSAHRHDGFWHPMDTLRDVNHLNEMWDQRQAPWKIW